MIAVSYPKAQGSYGRIECAALQLDGSCLRVVREELGGISHTLFASYDGQRLSPAGPWFKDAHEDLDEVHIEALGAEALGAARQTAEGLLVVGATEGGLALLSDRDGMLVVNKLGVFLSLGHPANDWQDLSGKLLGHRLLLATIGYLEGRDAPPTPWTLGSRTRPSALAERV